MNHNSSAATDAFICQENDTFLFEDPFCQPSDTNQAHLG